MAEFRLYIEAPKADALKIASAAETLLEEASLPVACFESDPNDDTWTTSIYCDNGSVETARSALDEALEIHALSLDVRTETLQHIDWVTATLQELAPVRAGRFVVHGSHDRGEPKPHEHAIEIDAGLAFGTGHHGTTSGCLLALDDTLKKTAPQRILDIGTGTGVLAIAAAKAIPAYVLATDIDPVAIEVAKSNARINQVEPFIDFAVATGVQHPSITRNAPYDLVIANILARPLEKMARGVSRIVAKGGRVILSGLLPHQKARIVAAYRLQGLKLVRSRICNGWLILELSKG